MNLSNFLKSFVFGFISLTLVSCDRPDSNEAKVTFKIPNSKVAKKAGDVSKLSQLGHIVINISGSGMPAPFVFNWDAEESNNNCSGETCTLIVPAGSDRLIQVLAVYKETDSENGVETMDFKYGDSVKSLTAGEQSVSVQLSSVLSGAVTEGEMLGRFMETSLGGPTGRLEIRYQPPAGKPSLVIQSTEMYGGWFRAFGFRGVPFQYVLNGKTIFSGDLSQFDSKLGNNLLNISWPSYFEEQDGNPKPRPASEQFVGFFGPGASATLNKICFKNTAGSVARAYNTSALDEGNRVSWPQTVSGGSPYSTTPDSLCSNQGAFRNVGFYIDPTTTGIPWLKMPFTNGDQLDTSSANMVKWSVLPGAANHISAFRLFALDSAMVDNFRSRGMGDGFRCNELDLKSKVANSGVVFAGEIGPAATQMSYNANLASKAKILCVRVGSVLMTSALRGEGSVNLSGVQANDFSFDMRNKVGNGQCHPFRLKLRHSSQSNVTNNVVQNFTVAGAGQGTTFKLYSSLNCAPGTDTTTYVVPAGSLEIMGSFSFFSNVSNHSVTISGMGSVSHDVLINAQTPNGTVDHIEYYDTPMKLFLAQGECRVVKFIKVDNDGFPTTGNISLLIDRIHISGTPMNDFAVNATCEEFGTYSTALSGTLSNRLMSSGNFTESLAIRTNPSAALTDRIVKIMNNALPINVADQAHHLGIRVVTPAPHFEGECVPVEISARNSDETLNTSANFSIQQAHVHDFNFGQLYSQNNCSGTVPINFNLTAGLYHLYLRIGSDTRATGTIGFEATSIFTPGVAYQSISFSSFVFNRPTAKLVLMADQAPRNTTIDNSSSATTWWPHDRSSFGGLTLGIPSYSASTVTTGSMPWLGGVPFTDNSVLKYSFTNLSNSDEFMASIIVKLDSISNDHTLFELLDNTAASLITKVRVSSDGKLEVLRRDLSTWSGTVAGAFTTGVFHKITIYWDGTDLTLRFNESYVGGESNWSYPNGVSNMGFIKLGASGGNGMNGSVKSFVLDGGSGAASVSYWTDNSHILNR